MRKDKEKAIELRRERNSYGAIVKKLKISKGTLSTWFAGEDWSEKIKLRNVAQASVARVSQMKSLNRIRGTNLRKAYDAAREEAKNEFAMMKYHPLFLAGVMLYWGEGDKSTKHQVRLTNTDPLMLRLYVEFLSHICLIPREKVHAMISAYPDLDIPLCRQFWSGRTAIPLSNFTKTALITGRRKTKRLSFGNCTVVVSSAYFKVKMLEWIRLASEELMKKEYYATI
jgi:hypothetical protein